MKPILTIAIPTYKRPDLLKKCLESIFSQGDPTWLSVIIFDDSVSDINQDVASWAGSAYQNFQFINNIKNLGIDENIEQCLNIENSEYVLVLGEDDVLMSGAIEVLRGLLQGSSVDLIFTSYVYVNNSLDKVIRAPFLVEGFIPPKIFIENYLWAIGFIGGTIFSVKYIQRSKRRFLGTYFNHVGRLANLIDMSTVIYASRVPLVGNRSEDISSATWSTSYYDVLFGFERLMDALAAFSPLAGSFHVAKTSFRKAMGHHSILRVTVMRSYGIYNWKAYKSFFVDDCLVRRVVLAFISILPPWVFLPIRVLFNIARYFKRMTYSIAHIKGLK